jgi:hypothetical protein
MVAEIALTGASGNPVDLGIRGADLTGRLQAEVRNRMSKNR